MRSLLLALIAGAASPLRAQMDMQHPMGMRAGPLGILETRMGSGTSWLPDASPMHASHVMIGSWTLMLHGKGFFQYDWQGGSRGGNQLGIVNWGMVAASRPLGGGQLQLRAMLSAEPWTIGSRGYPLLVQSGEFYQGAPLHDRQHPHDLFMELAALYERPVAGNLGLSLYLAPVGEPAVGPVAVPHPRALIHGATEALGPGAVARSVVLESTLDLDGRNAFFGRAEHVRKSAAELVIPSVPLTTEYDVGALALGYQRTVGTVAGFAAGVGVRGSVNFVPSSLNGVYGSRTPAGAAIYLQLRPAGAPEGGMKMGGMPGMDGGSHD